MRFVDLDDGEHVLSILRDRKSKILRRGSFRSWIKGWQAGQTFVRRWDTELQNQAMYIISVTKTVLTPDDSNNLNDNIIESEIIFSNTPYGMAF